MGKLMTEDEFQRIYRHVKTRYGIDMERKKEIVQGRLENYVQTGGYTTYQEYMNAVELDYTGKLERELVNLLTTNHTFFMREFDHFEYLKRMVLPELKQREEKNRDLCIWCGAASTGQEPYMLAMLLKDFFGLEHEHWDTKVLATDISTQVLEQAVRGIYEENQISVLPEHWKRRFLRPVNGGAQYEISAEIKEEVLFRQFNLMDTFPFKRRMHIIFLRNVMIYFDKETKRQLVQKVYDCMEPGGYLFIGQTETIDKTSVPFEMIRPSIFRKREG
ncbi:MAG: protein-glutamate O-methyltransferase CheR [Lachnospiraceae bacterium]|nr:protein-glutamate O-methyltransferase CheR [Lachnospiraceae bacterium]